MNSLAGMRVVIAGAGAFGSAIALELARREAAVVLADPAPLGANASGVAAGMLAPAMEVGLDPLSGGHFALLTAARDRWPVFAGPYGLDGQLDRCGAAWTGGEPEAAALLARLRSAGAAAEPISASDLQAMQPDARGGTATVFTAEDWRIEPAGALAAMRRAFEAAGGRVVRDAIIAWTEQGALRGNGGSLPGDALVLATGLAPSGWLGRLPEASVLQPIKGQILRFTDAPPTHGPILRGESVYIVPGACGPMAGATMEAGKTDLDVDGATAAAMRSAAERLIPSLASRDFDARAGVRAATSDGLPLVGWSSTPGVMLALGARRNGWLLAPMIAEMIADGLAAGSSFKVWPELAPARFPVC